MKTMIALIAMLLGLSMSNAGAQAAAPAAAPAAASAIFAGGCFWCVEADFEKLPGVIKVESGYIGGHVDNPTYEQVSAGDTGHTEAARISYDPTKVSYQQLLDYFWRNIDPTVKDRQFCDVGAQYRSGIFYTDEAQHRAAQASKDALQKSGRLAKIYTEITPAGRFYLAEEYHQDYYKKNPIRYKFYRLNCGRDNRLAELWGAK
ncbi:MAG: peptide-methionine (S)-S-oxide reductase MsrA [Burkholderiaceae bacterium]